jgi:16S rRNA (adenine1518-N6/adenine1519-N6)-dimethyltransferase
MTPTEARRLIAALGIHPSKKLGQNFLVDANISRIILDAARIRPDETVLEIGPGLGALTGELAVGARRVVAIERDKRLCRYLREKLPAVELIEGDALEVPLPACDKVVANLPYSISTPILERLVETEPSPRAMVLTLQREVAERLSAKPGTKDYGALTLFTQLRYHSTTLRVVSSGCFYPRPHVESAVIALDRREPRVRLSPGAPFHQIVRQGFSQRRKMLRKLVAGAGDALTSLGLPATARGEELSLEQWIALANALR